MDIPVSAILEKAEKDRRPLLSLEFFPPKTEQAAADLLKNAEAIATRLHPDFVSITYGAGGSTRQNTYLYGQILRERFGWTVMPHLTCVGNSRDEVLAIAESYHRLGIRSIMALRGDRPKEAAATPPADELKHASDLVRLLRAELPDLCLGVAGYPEKHPEAASAEEDLRHLKEKVDAGGSFVTTQMFFDVAVYQRFVERCRSAGITQPVLPGLLPVLSLEQGQKFCNFLKMSLPEALEARLKEVPAPEQWEVGVTWALEQIVALLNAGAPGIHLYILNRSQSLLKLLEGLRQRGIFRQS